MLPLLILDYVFSICTSSVLLPICCCCVKIQLFPQTDGHLHTVQLCHDDILGLSVVLHLLLLDVFVFVLICCWSGTLLNLLSLCCPALVVIITILLYKHTTFILLMIAKYVLFFILDSMIKVLQLLGRLLLHCVP